MGVCKERPLVTLGGQRLTLLDFEREAVAAKTSFRLFWHHHHPQMKLATERREDRKGLRTADLMVT